MSWAALLDAIVVLVTILIVIGEVYSPQGRKYLAGWLANLVGAALDVAIPIVGLVEGQLAAIVKAYVDSMNKHGGAIMQNVRGPASAMAQSVFDEAAGTLVNGDKSTPDNAVGKARDAIGNAFGFGVASAGVTAAFEAVFPEKLNTLNAAGPILAKMAGFDEVAALVRDPLYRNAFGRSLEYHYRSEFKPELPDEQDAVLWHARGLLSDPQLRTIFDFSGLKSEYEEAFITSAYRGLSPFLAIRMAESGVLTDAELTDIMTFQGFRPIDQARMVKVAAELVLKPYKDRALASIVIAAERGNLTDAELGSDLADLGLNADAANWVRIAVANRKLEQLAELYRKSIDEAYTYGLITDADYVPHLEAIGIAAADAEAHYAIVSFKKQGKALAAAERAAAVAERQREHAAIAAAIADYAAGNVDETALTAALAAAGMAPLIIPYVVAYQRTRRLSRRKSVAGVLTDPARATLLRERIAATHEQVVKKLITPDQGFADLTANGIPDANARLLIIEAAAAAKVKWP